MRCACFDITGTLVHHESHRPLPLMPKLLHSLREEGWHLKVITTWDMETAQSLLAQQHPAAFPADSIDIRTGHDKAQIVRQLLADDVDELVFVDDKPLHVEAVQRVEDRRIRAIGFFGSGKYAPEARRRFLKAGAHYALTAIDLAETLPTCLSHEFTDLKHLTIDELVDLVPGLRCPLSSLAGETGSFDHRMIPALLFRRQEEWINDASVLRRLWMNLSGCPKVTRTVL